MKFVEQSIQQFYRKIVLAAFGALLIALAIGWIINTQTKSENADRFLSLTRSDLLLGDYRTAMIHLAQAVPRDFLKIEYIDGQGKSVFTEGDVTSKILVRTISIPVRLTASSNSKASLLFYYNPWVAEIYIFFIWLLVLAANGPILLWLSKRQRKIYEFRAREASLARIGEITKQIAHDIRSPLSALKTLIPRLNHSSNDDRDIHIRALQRLENIAEDVLTLGRNPPESTLSETPSTKRNPVAPPLIPVNLNEIALSAITMKRAEFRSQSNVKIVTFFSEHPISIMADENKLHRIISNLLNNGIEAKKGDSVVLTLSTLAENGRGKIELRDNGKGIAPKILAHLGKRELSEGKTNGNGIGLYHAVQIIESWNGALKIFSQPDVGTTVVIELPVASVKN